MVRVLLVDDEQDFLDVMSQRIRSWDYTVVMASDGSRALEIIKERGADVVIQDYMMPGMDGLAVASGIRKINAKIPIIMFTAHPDQRAIVGAEKLGIAAFIPKFSSYSDSQSALKTALRIAEKKLKEKA